MSCRIPWRSSIFNKYSNRKPNERSKIKIRKKKPFQWIWHSQALYLYIFLLLYHLDLFFVLFSLIFAFCFQSSWKLCFSPFPHKTKQKKRTEKKAKERKKKWKGDFAEIRRNCRKYIIFILRVASLHIF